MGEEFVRTMCHDIEDPTFDATAAATNPRTHDAVAPTTQEPADRAPHCAWTVDIEAAAEPIIEAGITAQVAAGVALQRPCRSSHPGHPTGRPATGQ
ncbi:MAG: hypothetical protein R2789_13115 [Microthrixaceae bacterium]